MQKKVMELKIIAISGHATAPNHAGSDVILHKQKLESPTF
jgi:hypothetical protein